MERQLDDRGQSLPLVALLVVAIGLAGLGIGRAGASAVDAARARTAADAAALAGAAGGEEDARRLAAENGGRLRTYERAGTDVRVRVAVGGHVVSARARATAPMGTPVGERGLAPAMVAALARAAQLLGTPVPISSGFRTAAEQSALYARRGTNPYPVAPPGTSMHERGLAVDVPSAFAERLAAVGTEAGLCRPYPRTDPVHFELCGPRFPPRTPG